MFVKTRCLINVNYSQVSALNTAFLFSPAKLHYFFIIKLFHIIKLFATTLFIFLTTSTRTLYSHIICIICIYNITCISGFSRLGNIYIICIICTIYIINISLLWTNCGHHPHPFF